MILGMSMRERLIRHEASLDAGSYSTISRQHSTFCPSGTIPTDVAIPPGRPIRRPARRRPQPDGFRSNRVFDAVPGELAISSTVFPFERVQPQSSRRFFASSTSDGMCIDGDKHPRARTPRTWSSRAQRRPRLTTATVDPGAILRVDDSRADPVIYDALIRLARRGSSGTSLEFFTSAFFHAEHFSAYPRSRLIDILPSGRGGVLSVAVR